MLETRVAELLEAPDAKLVIERAQAILAAEAQRRRAFREWLRDDIKAEFINGEVIMHSPVKRRHLDATANLLTLLRVYVHLHNLGAVDSEKALVGLTRNDYEPDICYWTSETADSFGDDQMEHPAPDLIVEILAKSTTGRDRGIKFDDYAAHGVREYWIIDPVRKSVEQYQLDEATMAFAVVAVLYVHDVLNSLTVNGFQIPVLAIFDKQTNLDTLRKLLTKPAWLILNQMIIITEATEQALPIIQDIAYRTWPATFGEILSPAQIDYMLNMMYSLDSLTAQIRDKKHVFLLAQESESQAYLGFISYEFDYKDQAKTKIHKIYLLPASQGKGVGRLLIDKVATLATERANASLSLNVNKYNKAIQFYERMAFSTIDSETIDIGEGFLMEDHIMEKPLNT